MNKLTYIEAGNKIWAAYFREEIQPMEPKFCFCGTLCGGDNWSEEVLNKVEHSYSAREYGKMETALLKPLTKIGVERCGRGRGSWFDSTFGDIENDERYEKLLFKGLVEALEVLKQIHRERGEVIPEDEPLLTKRVLTSKI